MNWDQIEGRWEEFKGSVREEWGKLTDDDLAQVQGNREQLEGKIQQRYGKTKEDVRKEIDTFISSI